VPKAARVHRDGTLHCVRGCPPDAIARAAIRDAAALVHARPRRERRTPHAPITVHRADRDADTEHSQGSPEVNYRQAATLREQRLRWQEAQLREERHQLPDQTRPTEEA
jgi:hypothetical protein